MEKLWCHLSSAFGTRDGSSFPHIFKGKNCLFSFQLKKALEFNYGGYFPLSVVSFQKHSLKREVDKKYDN